MPSELMVVVDKQDGEPQSGGKALLQNGPDASATEGASTDAGFRFPLDADGAYILKFEPAPGSDYAWNLSVTNGTSIPSTQVAGMCVGTNGDKVYRATLHATLAKYWEGRAREKIGFVQGKGAGTFLEMNRKITSAYAEMYLQNPDVFKWAGMAALASDAVGNGMAQAEAYAESDIPLPPIPGLDFTWITGTEIRQWLGTGNLGVFADIYWQHVAYKEAGIDMLKFEGQEKRLEDRQLTGWKSIDDGVKAKNLDLVWKGNRDLLYYEQNELLQRRVYDQNRKLWKTLCAKPMKWFMTFTSPVPGDPTPFSGSDFGDAGQRWSWIDSSMLPAWKRLDADRPRAIKAISALPTV